MVNQALIEGSDATGAGAAAVQAASAATAATAAPVSGPQGTLIPSAPTTPAPSPSVPALATLAASSDGSGHARGGAGDSGGWSSNAGGDGAAALQQLSTPSAPAASTPAPTLRVHADVDSSDFPQGVADSVSMMVDNNWGSAKLQVNPPQLGPIELQIAVQGRNAQVIMSTHSAVTREALESSAPKLREMLGSQGFSQVSVDISQRSFQERSSYTPPYEWTPASSAPASNAVSPVSAAAGAASGGAARSSLGVLDAYA